MEWKKCPTYPGYCANEDGYVMNERTGTILGSLDKKGYLRTGVDRVHTMVADAWLGKRPEGLEIDHINRVKTDNRPCNLRYVTSSENNQNRGNFKNNKIGEKYIIFDEKNNRFVVNVIREGKKAYCSSFKTIEEAVIARDTFLNEGEKIQSPTATGQKNIHKHGNGFRVSFEKKVDGKKVRLYNKTFPTLEDAVKARDEYLASH